MHDWAESTFDQWCYRANAWLLVRIIPELKRLRSDEDRASVMMIASSVRSSRSRLWLIWHACTFLMVSVSMSMIGFYGGAWISRAIAPRHDDLFVSLVGAGLCFAASFVVYGALGWLFLGSQQRRTVYQVLANLDESICPYCGYDLQGHLPGAAQHDTCCPECGEIIPRLSIGADGS